MKLKAIFSHGEAIGEELQHHPEFGAEYLRTALEDNNEPKVAQCKVKDFGCQMTFFGLRNRICGVLLVCSQE